MSTSPHHPNYFLFAGKIYANPIIDSIPEIEPQVSAFSSFLHGNNEHHQQALLLSGVSLVCLSASVTGLWFVNSIRAKSRFEKVKLFPTGVIVIRPTPFHPSSELHPVLQPVVAAAAIEEEHQSEGLSTELRELGLRLTELSGNSSVEYTLDSIRELVFRMETESSTLYPFFQFSSFPLHPLNWPRSDPVDDLVWKAMCRFPFDSKPVNPSCVHCTTPSSLVLVPATFRASVERFVNRRFTDSALEEMYWFALVKQETSICELLDAGLHTWQPVSRTSLFWQLLAKESFSSPISCLSGSGFNHSVNTHLSWAKMDANGGALFGDRGSSCLERYDVLLDPKGNVCYFNLETTTPQDRRDVILAVRHPSHNVPPRVSSLTKGNLWVGTYVADSIGLNQDDHITQGLHKLDQDCQVQFVTCASEIVFESESTHVVFIARSKTVLVHSRTKSCSCAIFQALIALGVEFL